MKISAKSDKGIIREINEDTYAIGRFDDGTSYAVLCDGMGGHKGGEVASKIAVDTAVKEIEELFRPGMSFSNVKNMISSAISTANYKIITEANKNNEYNGMGTTVCIVVAFEDIVYIAHVGDSRVYLIKENNIQQITVDHSLVQELVDAGVIDEKEAKTHPKKNIITRALGLDDEVEFDITAVDIEKNDKILICSDGLTNMIDNDSIVECLQDDNVQDYAQRLVQRANEAGGLDNVTVVVMVK